MSYAFCSFSLNMPPRPACLGGGLFGKSSFGSLFGRLRFPFVFPLIFNARIVFFLFLLASLSWSQYTRTASLFCSSAVSFTNPVIGSGLSISSYVSCNIIGNTFFILCSSTASFPGNSPSVDSSSVLLSGNYISGSLSRNGTCFAERCLRGSDNSTVCADTTNVNNFGSGGQACSAYYGQGNGVPVRSVDGSSNGFCTLSYQSSVMPSCSDFLPIPTLVCKGGLGLWLAGGGFELSNILAGISSDPQGVWLSINSDGDTFERPDGSSCSLSNVSGPLYEAIYCPQGLEEEPSSSSSEESSSSSVGEAESSGSQGVSSASDGGSSSNSSCVCVAFVNGECSAWFPFGCNESSGVSSPSEGGSSSDSNCYCIAMVDGVCSVWSPGCNDGGGSSCVCSIMVNGECDVWDPPGCNEGGNGEGGDGGGSIGGDGDGEGGGISCKMLNDCDWAKFNVQLQQLGVEVQIRDAIRDMLSDLKDGKSLSGQQLGVLRGILDALNRGSGSSGSGGDGEPGGGSSAGSGWPSGTCDPRVSDCTHDFSPDGDTTWGVAKGYFDGVLSDYGLDSASLSARSSYARLLQDTSKVFPGMRRAIAPFNDYIRASSQNCGTVLDFSFSIAGFSCGQTCRIDLSSFGGYPVGRTLTDIMTIAFGLGVLIRLLYVVRTVGQKG